MHVSPPLIKALVFFFFKVVHNHAMSSEPALVLL